MGTEDPLSLQSLSLLLAGFKALISRSGWGVWEAVNLTWRDDRGLESNMSKDSRFIVET